MANQEPTFDPHAEVKRMEEEAIRSSDQSWRDERRKSFVPYGVDLWSKTFYFGPESPTEESWEIAGDWVETQNGVEISRIEVFPSRRIVVLNGATTNRAEGSAPSGGLNRDIMRRLGSDAPIRRAILRQKDAEAEGLLKLAGNDLAPLPDWVSQLMAESGERKHERADRGYGFDWWVACADEYLAVVEVLRTSYGAQAQLADDTSWGVGIAGTRWRVARLREMGLIDDAGPLPGPGPNYPRKETADGKDT